MIGKRGQFYLIAAIILVLVFYSFSTRVNVFYEEPEFTDFSGLASNYVNEVAKVINHGIYNNIVDIPANLVNPFTQDFLIYARTRDPNIGLVYVYGDNVDGERTIIENHLTNQIVTYNSSDPGNLGGVLFDSQDETINEIRLSISGEEFIHNVPTKLSSFSSSYYSASVNGPVDFLRMDLAGVPFLFDSSGGNDFEVIINTIDESSGATQTASCRYSGSGAWQSCT